MTYSDVVGALPTGAIEEDEALTLVYCKNVLELCETAIVERNEAGKIHDEPMAIAFSWQVIRQCCI